MGGKDDGTIEASATIDTEEEDATDKICCLGKIGQVMEKERRAIVVGATRWCGSCRQTWDIESCVFFLKHVLL